MDIVVALFGEGRLLDPMQMAARAIAVFFIALVMIRIAGRRAFGQRSPFDCVVGILLGAMLSRAIAGASPFVATIAASFAIVVVHRALAWMCVRWARLERLMVGAERELYRDGRFNEAQMRAALITVTDVQESVRQSIGQRSLAGVSAAILERNGHVSVIRRKLRDRRRAHRSHPE
ncbi:DUF421 domain-containing protein [Burkholderia multivorans]|uniref:DUF421 domain-containing protein n=1 Tax=Burkholderia ubonensis TaxID=101571 RepID=UPI000F6E84F3|nr:YetF domain-containing protein [Burkholderia ubonensis]AYZ64482.1 DUF421 domain-containing protein [Burkholderia multivorans]VWB06976.1 hypothetical protein BUB20358_00139 [Burkholderia ubonensis]